MQPELYPRSRNSNETTSSRQDDDFTSNAKLFFIPLIDGQSCVRSIV